MTPKPHELLASAIDARRGELGLSLREIAELADIAPETLRAVRKGTNDPSVLTKRGLERALQWTSGSVDRVLEGGEPGEHRRGTGTVHLTTSASAAGVVRRKHQITDEEIINSGLRPETVEALLRMRRRIERLVAERDEDAIRRAERVIRALDEDRDAG